MFLLGKFVITLIVVKYVFALQNISLNSPPPPPDFVGFVHILQDISKTPITGTRGSRRLLGNGLSSTQSIATTVPTSVSALKTEGGTHYTELFVGSPPQRRGLIIDTGSHFMAFPCSGCSDCGLEHENDYFNVDYSASSNVLDCDQCEELKSFCGDNNMCYLKQSYVEGSSWTAIQVEDVVWLGASSEFSSFEIMENDFVNYVFGCQVAETGLFKKQAADGILGLAMHENGFVQHLVNENVISHKMFSLCLSKVGGQVAWGGMNGSGGVSGDETQTQFTHLLQGEHGHFAVTVERLRLNNIGVWTSEDADVEEAISGFNKGKGTIFDSGTTDTYFPVALSKNFRAVWRQQVGSEFDNKTRKFASKELARLPTITLVLRGGGEFKIEPAHYLESDLYSDSRKTIRIYLDEPEGAVIGANALFGKNVLFDEENRRIGWHQADCEF